MLGTGRASTLTALTRLLRTKFVILLLSFFLLKHVVLLDISENSQKGESLKESGE